MKKEVFFKTLVDELDLEDIRIDENSPLNLTSLKTLSLISFLDEHFGVRVKANALIGMDSVEKIMTLIGKDKIE